MPKAMNRVILLFGVLATLTASSAAQPFMPKPPGPVERDFVWDRATAAHLLRRAGFSAPPKELDRVVAQGFTATIDELTNFEAVDDFEMEAGLAAEAYELTRVNQNNRVLANGYNMNRWWLYRMIHSRRQLLEKMVLFWHDHFATSISEVRFVRASTGEPLLMIQQDLFRRQALGNFKEMIREIARDPAMLLWLDNFQNIAEEPNENWSRELLELFTMGVDQYTQTDIQEASRAFTGWTFERNRRDLNNFDFEFEFVPQLHDFGQKTFLGRTGAWDGDDIIDIVFDQDVVARFISRKLWEFFAYPEPSDQLISELARVFRESGYELRPLLSAVFRHPEFYSERSRRALMKSPTEMLVNFMREMELGKPSLLPLYSGRMTQYLFAPPDVGGWTSGVGWVNTSTLLSRFNFFNDALTYRGGRPDVAPAASISMRGRIRVEIPRVDYAGIIEEYGLVTAEDVVDHFVERLVQGDVTDDERMVLEEYLLTAPDGSPAPFDLQDPVTVDTKLPGIAVLIAILPVNQLN